MNNDRHVYPKDEEGLHIVNGDTSGTDCLCDPRIEIEGGSLLVIHNSFNHREFIEQAIDIMNEGAEMSGKSYRDTFLELATRCQYDAKGMSINENQKSSIVWAEAALRGAENAQHSVQWIAFGSGWQSRLGKQIVDLGVWLAKFGSH